MNRSIDRVPLAQRSGNGNSVCYQSATVVGTNFITAKDGVTGKLNIMGSSNMRSRTETPLVQRSEELVDRFLDAIWMERGLSKNTLGA